MKESNPQATSRTSPQGDKPAVPAATVILLRDTPEGLATLMLRRNSKLDFAGGMWVFPGGRVDPEDRRDATDDEMAVARVAASREAQEESGLLVAPEAMLTFSHWMPPAISPKRFSTWFFAAEASTETVTIDDGEIKAHAWMRPADALQRRDDGEIELTPPTWVTLHELREWPDVQAALRGIAARTPEHFTTRVARGGQRPMALWHGDAGYEDGDVERSGPRHRLSMGPSPWRYQRG